MKLKIMSTGMALPPTIETAADLAPRIGRSEQWIVSRTGVKERRISHEALEVLGARAAKAALGDGPPPDLVLNASASPKQVLPDTSVFVARELGYDGIPCHSVHATCLSFLVALQTAAAFLNTGMYKRILIVSTEKASITRNWDEPESAVLLGDGAAAVVVELPKVGEESAILAHKMTTHPQGIELTQVRGGGTVRHPNDPKTTPEDNLFTMHGPGIYRMARRRVADLLKEIFTTAGLPLDDTSMDLIIPHQASGMAVAAVSRYGFPEERVVNLVGQYGNTIAASLPMALAHAHQNGRLARGNRVLLLGTGAGLSVAATIIRW